MIKIKVRNRATRDGRTTTANQYQSLLLIANDVTATMVVIIIITTVSHGVYETKQNSFSLPAVIFGTTSPPKWGETYSDLELFGGELEGDMLIGVHLCLLVGRHIGGSKSNDRFSVAQAMALFDVRTTPTTSANTEKPIRLDGETGCRRDGSVTKLETTRGVFAHGTKWLLYRTAHG